MSEPTSPSPPPRPEHRSQTQLLPSSIFSTPSLSSTLPLPRPTSASGGLYRNSIQRRGRTGSSRRRHTRSVTSASPSSDGDGSLGDFSMENYTIDLAQLGRKVGGAPMVGAKHADNGSKDCEPQPAVKDRNEDLEEDGSDYFDGDYSIDLGALGDSSDSVMLEERAPQRDQIPSEDDGPEDFTLNLEKWMRGTEKWEKKIDIKKLSDEHGSEDDRQKGVQIEPKEPVDESVFEPVGASTPAPLNHAVEDFQESRLAAPPLSRLNTEMRQDNTAEEVFDRIAALQAEVESMRMEEENRRLAHQGLEQENEGMKIEHKTAMEREQLRHDTLQQEQEQLKQAHRETQEALRRENEQLKQNYDDAIEQLQVLAQEPTHGAKADQIDAIDGSTADELAKLKAKGEADQIEAETNIKVAKSELRSFQDECFTLRAEIEAVKGTCDSTVKELNAELEAKKTEVALERKESMERGNEVASLNATIEQKDKKVYAMDGEIKALRTELRHAHDQLAELDVKNNEIALERKESIQRGNEAASLTETIEQKEREIYALNGEVKAIKMELEHAQQQLVETRRILETVEDENDRLMQQNDRQAEEMKDLKMTIESYTSKEPMAGVSASSAKETQQNKNPERIDKAIHEAALEALSQQHQGALDLLGDSHGKELQILRSALTKASLAMQKREAKLARIHQEEVASLKEEITGLKQSATTSSDTGIENELRSAIRVLISKLEKANALVRSARAEAAEARQKVDDMRDTNAAVNAELEARFANAVEAREKEWRRRIALMFRERDKMAKALMWGWGREEVGPGEPGREQGYQYKYVTR